MKANKQPPHHVACVPIIFLTLLTAFLAGCASTPVAPPVTSQPSANFAPPTGRAGLYVVRPHKFAGHAVAMWEVGLDNQLFGTVDMGAYLHSSVLPGRHVLRMQDGKTMAFDAEAGRNYYFTFVGLALKLKPVSEAEGETAVQESRLGRDNRYFLPEPVDSAIPAICRVVVPQSDPYVVSRVTKADNMPYTSPGLVDIGMDMLFNAMLSAGNKEANKERQLKADKMSVPLAGHGLGAEARRNLQSALAVAAAASPWLHCAPLETITTTNQTVTVDEVSQHPVLQINVVYHLAIDASALIMQARLMYFRQGQTNSTYARYYTYFSEPVGPERDDAAVAKWTASGQQLLRQRMDEGIKEIVSMADLDFFHKQPLDPAQPIVKISGYDATYLRRAKWEGLELRNENPRIVFQAKSDNLFSLVPDK